VVDVLAAKGGGYALAVSGALNLPLVTELSLLLHQVPLGVVMVAVVELAVLDGAKLGLVGLWEHLAVKHWLNCAVVVVLVDLLVDGGHDLLMVVRLDGLVDDGRGNSLVHCGVVVAGAAGEVGEGCFDLVHVDYVVVGRCIEGFESGWRLIEVAVGVFIGEDDVV
jgi:hypothetical protein